MASPTGTTVDNTMIISGSGTISVVVTSSDPCVMAGDSAVTASVNMTVVAPGLIRLLTQLYCYS